MSTFIHCSMIGVVAVYHQIRKSIQSVFVSRVLSQAYDFYNKPSETGNYLFKDANV